MLGNPASWPGRAARRTKSNGDVTSPSDASTDSASRRDVDGDDGTGRSGPQRVDRQVVETPPSTTRWPSRSTTGGQMPGGDAVAARPHGRAPRRCGTIWHVVRSTVVTKHGSQASSTPASPNIRSNIGRAVRTESNDTIGTVNRRWIAGSTPLLPVPRLHLVGGPTERELQTHHAAHARAADRGRSDPLLLQRPDRADLRERTTPRTEREVHRAAGQMTAEPFEVAGVPGPEVVMRDERPLVEPTRGSGGIRCSRAMDEHEIHGWRHIAAVEAG